MRCAYCDVEVTQYPENGICVCCGGRLPPRPAVDSPMPAPAPVPVSAPIAPPVRFVPGVNCCPKCLGRYIV